MLRDEKAAPQQGRAPVDLHMHSTASDGSLPPEAVVQAAHTAGLGVIALTDHDTLAGVEAARREGDRLGVRVITGVELDRKSTRLNSSHLVISYAVFCLKKKTK